MPRFPRSIDRSPEPEEAPATPVVPTCPHDGGAFVAWKTGSKCATCGCGFIRGAWVAQAEACPRFSMQFRSEIPPPEVAIE